MDDPLSVTRKKSPNVYKSYPKFNKSSNLVTLDPLTNRFTAQFSGHRLALASAQIFGRSSDYLLRDEWFESIKFGGYLAKLFSRRTRFTSLYFQKFLFYIGVYLLSCYITQQL